MHNTRCSVGLGRRLDEGFRREGIRRVVDQSRNPSPREQLYFSRTITQVYRYCIPRVERRMYFGLGYHTTLAAANVLIMYQVFACVYDVAFPRNDEASVGPVRQAEAGCF